VAATGLAIALAAAAPLAASAEPVPAADCSTPALSAEPIIVSPGTVLTVSGEDFSGCATVDGIPGTPVIPVEVGIYTDQKMAQVLAETQTAADGSFTVQVTIPAVASAGDKIILIAASADEATGLVYQGLLTLGYTAGGTTPTAVPAGVGDLAASASDSDKGLLVGIGAAGLLLVAGGATAAVRRREHEHQH
jgi:hypothetical protein